MARKPGVTANGAMLKYWKRGAVILVGVAVLMPFGLRYFESSEYASVTESIERQRVPIDPRLLKDYAGTYQLRPGFEVEVTVVSGNLFAQGTNQQRVGFHPASDTVFFNDITPLLMKFERDDDGKVIRFRALEPGRNRIAKKVESTPQGDDAASGVIDVSSSRG